MQDDVGRRLVVPEATQLMLSISPGSQDVLQVSHLLPQRGVSLGLLLSRSTECQTVDWKAGHKLACSKKSAVASSSSPSAKPCESRFGVSRRAPRLMSARKFQHSSRDPGPRGRRRAAQGRTGLRRQPRHFSRHHELQKRSCQLKEIP